MATEFDQVKKTSIANKLYEVGSIKLIPSELKKIFGIYNFFIYILFTLIGLIL